MRNITLLFCLFLILQLSNLKAQLNWVSYGNSNHVNALCEDGNFIWEGTNYGLIKRHKNGSIVAHLFQENSGLVYNEVNALALDFSGNLWIGTDFGLSCYNTLNNTWQNYTSAETGLSTNLVDAIAIDINGDKWFSSFYGVAKFDDSNWTVYSTSNSPLPDPYLKCIAIDAVGNKWIGTGNGLAKFDGTNWTIFKTTNSGLPDNDIRSIAIDLSGRKWIGTTGGLAVYDDNNWSTYTTSNSGITSNFINSVAIDGNSNCWIGGDFCDLLKFNGTTWTVYNHSNSGMPNDFVCAIIIDAVGNTWAGLNSEGVTRFNNITFSVYTISNVGLSSDWISSIAIDNSGNKWIGTGDGLSKFDNINWTTYNSSNSVLSSGVGCVTLENNIKWIGSCDGLVKFDNTNWTVYNTSNSGLPANCVTAIKIDGSGNKWIGTYTGGLAIFNGSSWTVYNTSNSNIPSNYVTSMSFDSNGNKWIGTDNGLAKFDGSNWTIYNTSNSQIPSNMVTSIYIDAAGYKWVGTDNGLGKFTGIGWGIYNTSNVLPQNSIVALSNDNSGNLWIGLESYGLVKTDGSNFVNYSNFFVESITPDSQDNLWICSFGGLTKISCEEPVVDFTSDTVCLPSETTHFYPVCSKTDVFTKYQWDIDNNGSIDFNSFDINHIFSTPGVHPVKFTVINGACSTSVVKNVIANSIPSVTIMSSGPLNLCSGEQITLTAQINNFNSGFNYTYLWSDGSTTPSINVSSTGSFSVTVFDESCSSTISIMAILDSMRYEGSGLDENGWSIEYTIGSYWLQAESNGPSLPGTNAALFDCIDAPAGTIQSLVSPLMQSSNPGTLLTFDVAHAPYIGSLENDQIAVYTSANNSTYTQLAIWDGNGGVGTGIQTSASTGSFFFPESNEWTTKTLSLPTGTVRYKITGISDYGNNIWVDNIIIYSPVSAADSTDTTHVFVQQPFYNEQICLVTVDTVAWKNKIMWEKTPDQGTAGYEIFKEVATNIYNNIGFVPYDSVSVFIDYNSVPESHGDKYKISIVDTCTNSSSKSFYHKTMNLVLSSFGSTIGLSWTPYEDESGVFVPSKYYIYRGSDPNDMQLLDSVSGSFTSYNDNNVFDMYYYMVGVERDIPCNTSMPRKSYSNKRQTPLGIETTAYSGVINISPNPMTNFATLEVPNFSNQFSVISNQLTITDITGKVVRVISSEEMDNLQTDPSSNLQIRIDRGNLKPGIYFVEINFDRLYRGKLVVE